MLRRNCRSDGSQQRPNAAPLLPFLKGFLATEEAQGFGALTLEQHRRVLEKLNQWMSRGGIHVAELNETRLQEFLSYWQRRRPCIYHGRRILPKILEYLQEQGVSAVPPEPRLDATGELLQQFSDYLREERGLAPCTIRRYGGMVRRFLQAEFQNRPLELTELNAAGILNFIRRFGKAHSPTTIKHMVQGLRAFLRWLHFRGDTSEDFATILFSVTTRRLSSVPDTLSATQIRRLLQKSSGNSAVDIRNRAVLLLLARLGLRAGEIVRLRLGDIDWRNGVIALRRKPGRDDQMPLPPDVGEILSAYIQNVRPQCSQREVFLCANAPFRPFSSSSTVSCIVARALQRADIEPQRGGAHLLRHTLASILVNKGTALAEIGDLLGHRSLSATEIYTKVDLRNLRLVTQPWPGGIR